MQVRQLRQNYKFDWEQFGRTMVGTKTQTQTLSTSACQGSYRTRTTTMRSGRATLLCCGCPAQSISPTRFFLSVCRLARSTLTGSKCASPPASGVPATVVRLRLYTSSFLCFTGHCSLIDFEMVPYVPVSK